MAPIFILSIILSVHPIIRIIQFFNGTHEAANQSTYKGPRQHTKKVPKKEHNTHKNKTIRVKSPFHVKKAANATHVVVIIRMKTQHKKRSIIYMR